MTTLATWCPLGMVPLVVLLALVFLGSTAAAWTIRQHAEWAEMRRFQRLRTALSTPATNRPGRAGVRH